MTPMTSKVRVQFSIVWLVVLLLGCKPSQPAHSETHGANPEPQPTSLSTEATSSQVLPAPPEARFVSSDKPLPAAGTKGVAVEETAPIPKSPPPYHNVFIICVGVNQNPAYGNLQFAVNDATELASLFKTRYGFTNIITLTDTNATKTAVTNALARIRTQLNADGKDDVLFFYSGHGDTWSEGLVQNGQTNVTRHGFLVTYHPAEKMPATLAELRERHLEMSEAARLVSELPARHRLMFVDSCFSGLAFVQRELVEARPNELYQDVIASPTVQILTAGLDSEVAREDPQSRHGVFTDALLYQIRATNVLTMEEVFFPLRVAVRASLERMNHPLSMSPQHRYLLYTNGTFVFVPLDRRDSWATSRPTNSLIAQATARGCFRPVTLTEVTNLNTSAKSMSDSEWQAEVDRYETRAAMGDPYANVALAQIYERGIGVPTNANRARLYHGESRDFLTASRTLNIASLVGIKDPDVATLLNSLVRVELPGETDGVDPETRATVIKGFGKVVKSIGSTVGKIFKKDEATVEISFQGKPVAIPVKVTPPFNKQEALDGIAAFQIGDFTNAAGLFTKAVVRSPKNAEYRFGLAVALEATGDFEGARKHYVEANRLASGKGNLAAQEGIKRVTSQTK